MPLSSPSTDRCSRLSGRSSCVNSRSDVGAPATTQLALPALRKGGQMVVVGLFGGALPVPLPALAMREVSLRGSAVGNTAQIRELVQLVREGKLKLPAVQVRPLADAEAALRDLEAGKIIGRVVMTPA